MDGRIMKWGLMLLLCIPFWTACNNDDVPEAAIEPQKDCEVSVSIRLNAKSLRAMGDPGEEVDEFDSQYWTYSWCTVGDRYCNILSTRIINLERCASSQPLPEW